MKLPRRTFLHLAAGVAALPAASVDLVHVHHRSSGPALTDLISGPVQATFDPLPASIEFIRARKLRPLA